SGRHERNPLQTRTAAIGSRSLSPKRQEAPHFPAIEAVRGGDEESNGRYALFTFHVTVCKGICQGILLLRNALEIRQGSLQALMAANLRLPVQKSPSAAGIGPTQLRVILRQRTVFDRALASRKREDFFGEFQNRHLVRVAEVHRLMKIGEQQPFDPFDEIGNK